MKKIKLILALCIIIASIGTALAYHSALGNCIKTAQENRASESYNAAQFEAMVGYCIDALC